eukprot:gene13095-13222_t
MDRHGSMKRVRAQGLAIAEEVGVSKEARVADVKARHVRQVVTLLNERYKIGDELKRLIRDDILRLIEANTYRTIACNLTG